MRVDAVAVILKTGEPVCEMHAMIRQDAGNCAMQVGAMKGVVGRAERRLDRLPQWRAKQKASIVPAPLVERARFDARPSQRVRDPEPIQNARRVGADIDAGADFAERFGLLVDLDLESGAQQRCRRRESTNAAADDCDRGGAGRHAAYPLAGKPAQSVNSATSRYLRFAARADFAPRLVDCLAAPFVFPAPLTAAGLEARAAATSASASCNLHIQ